MTDNASPLRHQAPRHGPGGRPVTLRLKPTAVAKRKATRLKGVRLTIRVVQGSSTRTLTVRLR